MALLQRISGGWTSLSGCTFAQRKPSYGCVGPRLHSLRHVSLNAVQHVSRVCAQRLFRTRAAGDAGGAEEATGSTDAVPANASAPSPTTNDQNSSNLVASIGLGVAYLCLIGYTVFLAPDQTPARDLYFIKKGVNLITDSYTLPTVWTSLWYAMGVYPALYASLLVPTGRSNNKISPWPFAIGSFALGAFALMPYFILWQPVTNPPPPSKEQSVTKTITSTVVPLTLVAAAAYCWVTALTAGPAAWTEFLRLFDESKFTHVMSIDFCTLTVLLPFWMWNDAQVRGWEPRDKVLPFLSVLPVLGPAIYLVLRPKNY